VNEILPTSLLAPKKKPNEEKKRLGKMEIKEGILGESG